ncbi:MAG TPA: hypothetical protein VI589_11745 [Vicinamibacteria bacterium]
MTALVDRIRALPRAERLALYAALPPGLLASQRFAHAFWARPEQALPELGELATIEVARGGRRAGKTWWATQLFNREMLSGRYTRGRIIAATDAAVLATVIDGPSGIRTWLPPHLRPTFVRSNGYAGTLEYPNGRIVLCCSAQQPGQAIGQGCDLTLADDPAGWVESCGEAKATATFKQARVSNSEGPRPCMIVPTTKRGTSFLRRLLAPGEMRGVRVRQLGGTRVNTALSPAFLRDTVEDLEGDDWAAEELDDEDRDQAAGALWKREWIDPHRVRAHPELERVVVAVDPADDGEAESDETGIVVVGLAGGRLFVLADFTARHDAVIWPAIAAWAFAEYECDAIVAETNRAASLVRQCLRVAAPHVPVVEVKATRGKATRAQPLALLYRDGRVSHLLDGPQLSRPGPVRIQATVFDPATGRREEIGVEVLRDKRRWRTLEDELCGWVPRQGRSPNGLDALVWGAWYLCPPEGPGGWAPAPLSPSLPSFEGRYAGVDPRRARSRFLRDPRAHRR